MGLFDLIKDGIELFERWPRLRERLKDTRLRAWLEKPLPTVEPDKGFAVAIVHLENDDNHEFENLVYGQLEKLKDFQVLRFDRKISVSTLDQGSAIGHNRARELLEESGADVLVWGNVIRIANSAAPRLYFTTLRHGISAEDPYSVRKFKLPEVFWRDLADIVSLMTLSSQAELRPGTYSYDRLSSFIDRVKGLLEWSRRQPGWTAFDRVRVEFAIGRALCLRGNGLGQREDLQKALEIFQASLMRPEGASTPQWSSFQQTLGETIFLNAGELSRATGRSETELYGLSIEAFRVALDGLSAAIAPGQRALCLFLLGSALQLKDFLAPNSSVAEEALASFEQCTTLWKRDTDGLRWGLAQMKMGEMLTRIGVLQKNEDVLYKAVIHCLEARKRLACVKDFHAVSALIAAGKAVDALKAMGDGVYKRYAAQIDKAFLDSSVQRETITS
jgi:hypothetical protein